MADRRVWDPTRPHVPYEYSGAPDQHHPLTLADLEPQHAVELAARAAVIEHDRAAKRRMPVNVSQGGATDGSGNLTMPVYEVGAGFLLSVRRIVVECNTFVGGTKYTPAAPYSAATFWLGVFQSQNPLNVAQGSLLDFAPTLAGAQGIPNVAAYDEDAMFIQGQHYLVVQLTSGPSLANVTVRMQGWIWGEQI